MIIYRNLKVKVHSPDGDRDFFDIVDGVLQRGKLTPNMFITCLDDLLRKSIDIIKENWITLRKGKKQTISPKTTMAEDYADNIELLANTPAQAKSPLHGLEQVEEGIGLYVNANQN